MESGSRMACSRGDSLDGTSHICRDPAYKRKGFAHPSLCSEAIRIPNVYYPTILKKGGGLLGTLPGPAFGCVPRDIARLRYTRPGHFPVKWARIVG